MLDLGRVRRYLGRMKTPRPPDPSRPPSRSGADDRLARALRANLARRKAQMRARGDGAPVGRDAVAQDEAAGDAAGNDMPGSGQDQGA